MRTRDLLNRTGRWASKLFAGVAAGCLIALSSSHSQASTIFSDGFGSSTVNQTDTSINVTSTSTSYDPASNKSATATVVGPGDLELAYSSSNGAASYEALFTQTPVTLSQTGPTTIEADLTFVATSGDVLQAAGGNYTFLGLFNSNGNVTASPSTVPYTGLGSSGLGSGTADALNGVQGWVGYNAQISAAGANAINTYLRGAQSGATQAVNQDLVTGGVNSGYSVQTSLGTTAATYDAVIGDTYTQDLTLTLNADGSLTTSSSLYLNTGSGSGTAGTLEEGNTKTVLAASSPNLTYDGIGFGMRGPTQRIDYSLLTITDNAPAANLPEPAALSLLGLSGCGLLRRRARRC